MSTKMGKIWVAAYDSSVRINKLIGHPTAGNHSSFSCDASFSSLAKKASEDLYVWPRLICGNCNIINQQTPVTGSEGLV